MMKEEKDIWDPASWADWDPDKEAETWWYAESVEESRKDEARRRREEDVKAQEKLEALLGATKTDETIIKLPLEVYELDWLFEVVFPDAVAGSDARHDLVGGVNTTGDYLRVTHKRYLRRARKAGYIPRQEREEKANA